MRSRSEYESVRPQWLERAVVLLAEGGSERAAGGAYMLSSTNFRIQIWLGAYVFGAIALTCLWDGLLFSIAWRHFLNGQGCKRIEGLKRLVQGELPLGGGQATLASA